MRACLSLIGLCCSVAVGQPTAPSAEYRGVPLSTWLARLDDPAADKRTAARRAVTEIGPAASAAVPTILARLEANPTPADHAAYLDILAAIGPDAEPAVPFLIAGVNHPEHGPACLRALEAIGPRAKAAIPALVGQLKAESAAALKAFPRPPAMLPSERVLCAIGPDAVPAFVALLTERTGERVPEPSQPSNLGYGLRSIAARGLAKLGPAGEAALLSSLRHDDGRTRTAAAFGLGIRPDAPPAVVYALVENLDNKRGWATPGAGFVYQSGETGWICGRMLDDFGPVAGPALIRATTHERAAVRLAAARVLAKRTPPLDGAIDAVRALEKDADAAVREAASKHLKRMGKSDSELLLANLEDWRFAETDLRREAERRGVMQFDRAQGRHALPVPDAAVPALRKGLDSPTAVVRAYAAVLLGAAGPAARDAVPRLLELTKDQAETDRPLRFAQQGIPVSRYAIPALGMVGADPAVVVPELRALLRSRSGVDRAAAAQALLALGPAAAPAADELVSTLDFRGSYEEDARGWAAAALLSAGPAARPHFARLPKMIRECDETQIYDDDLLARGGPEFVPTLLLEVNTPGIGRPAIERRVAAALALTKVRPLPRETVPLLAGFVAESGKSSPLRAPAAKALASLGPDAAAAVPAFRTAIQSPDFVAPPGFYGHLAHLGPTAVPVLLEVVANPAERDKGNAAGLAATALAGMGPMAKDAALPVLLTALRAKHATPAIAAALGRLDPTGTTADAVVAGVRDGSIRPQAAARALSQMGPAARAGAGALAAGLTASDEAARVDAAGSLALLGPAAAGEIPALVAVLKDPDRAVRAAAADALGVLGETAAPAVKPLIDARRDRHPAVRTAATQALGRIGPAAKEVAPALLADVQSWDFRVREPAAAALLRIDPSAARAAYLRW